MAHYTLQLQALAFFILIGMHLMLCYTVPFPADCKKLSIYSQQPSPCRSDLLLVGKTSRSRSYRKQELAPTEDRMGKMERPDVKRKNPFVLVPLLSKKRSDLWKTIQDY
jgi:hypothetical protein